MTLDDIRRRILFLLRSAEYVKPDVKATLFADELKILLADIDEHLADTDPRRIDPTKGKAQHRGPRKGAG